MKNITCIIALIFLQCINSQNLGQGYIANDLSQHIMQPLSKPAYLQAVTDPAFPNTQIRRISQATEGNFVVPMYSTIQSWNADESLMLVYGGGVHQLLDGEDYTFIRNLNDISPDDLEAVFWSFSDPDILFYMDNEKGNLYNYNVQTQVKTVIVNIRTISGCDASSELTSGNGVQMMSWDNDVFSFRCGETSAYYYRISTGQLTQFNIQNLEMVAPMPFPSGQLFFHKGDVYDTNGDFVRSLDADGKQHSCLGKLSNGDDAYYAIAFPPEGDDEIGNPDCLGTLVAHNATDGSCFAVTPNSSSTYGYPRSGTHISALAHKNNEDGWVAVSCMGFWDSEVEDEDEIQTLDQELFLAKVNATDADVYRVAHHRSDEEQIDYFGEPHVTISPTGTRLLFGSDWSGTEDGVSVDAYVAELNSYTLSLESKEFSSLKLYPNPVNDMLNIETLDVISKFEIYTIDGKIVTTGRLNDSKSVDVSGFSSGMYFIKLYNNQNSQAFKFIKN